MFNLNPLNNPDALWQHAVMLIVASIIGYIIGHMRSKETEQELEKKHYTLVKDLEWCILQKQPVPETQTLVQTEATEVTTKDDLTVIEGIGPKIATLLQDAGIQNFLQLSVTTPQKITEILNNAGPSYRIHDPGTWPQQAALAANKMWDQLKILQDELNKGRSES